MNWDKFSRWIDEVSRDMGSLGLVIGFITEQGLLCWLSLALLTLTWFKMLGWDY